MNAHAPNARHWTVALWVAALATVAPLFVAEYLPFTDLPEHLAVMSAFRHWSDPAFRVREHYVLALGQSQYLLYHLAGALLSFVTGGVENANRILLAAVGIAFPFSFRALLRALGRDERLALFACPLFWSRPLLVGFLPFVASIPMLLVTLAVWARQIAAPTRRRAFALTALAVVVFYMHAASFMMLVLAAASMGVFARFERASWIGSARRVARELWWLVPAMAMAVVWWAAGRLGLEAEGVSESRAIARMSFARTVRAFALWTHDVWWSHVDEACAVVYWLAFIALLALGMRRTRDAEGTRDLTFVPFVCAGAVFLLLPFQIGAGYMLNVRMAPVLALFAVLAVQSSNVRAATAPLALVFASTLVTAANAAHEIRSAQKNELGDIDSLLERMRPGARVVSLSFRLSSAHTHFPPWLYLGTYHRVRTGGLAAYSFTEMTHWPLHYARDHAPPPKPALWIFKPCTYRNAVDGEYYDYVLVRGDVDPFRDSPPGPVFREIARVKDFVLYGKQEGERFPAWETEDQGPCIPRDP